MSQSKNTDDPIRDKERIEELARLRLNEDQVDDILNNMAEKAANEFDLPVGMINVVLDEAQMVAGSHGLGDGWIAQAGGTPVEWSFCATSVETKKPFVVEDAETHERTKDNPLVHHDNIKCYAGCPMVTSNGYIIGNFCVIGTEERTFTEEEISKLKDFAKRAVQQIEDRVKE